MNTFQFKLTHTEYTFRTDINEGENYLLYTVKMSYFKKKDNPYNTRFLKVLIYNKEGLKLEEYEFGDAHFSERLAKDCLDIALSESVTKQTCIS